MLMTWILHFESSSPISKTRLEQIHLVTCQLVVVYMISAQLEATGKTGTCTKWCGKTWRAIDKTHNVDHRPRVRASHRQRTFELIGYYHSKHNRAVRSLDLWWFSAF